MAETEDSIFKLPESVSGLLNPVLSFAFGQGDGNLTLEQLKRRRAVAAALAGQKRPFPKTIGEGIASLGESIGDVINERRLTGQEAAYEKGVAGTRAAGGLPGQPAPAPTPAVAAPPAVGPVVPPRVTPPVPGPARPSAAPPAPAGPMAGVDPATWEPPPGSPGSRDSIARALQPPPALTEGGLPPNPTLAGPQAPTTDMPVPPLGGPSDSSLDSGATFSDEGDPTPTDIQPMPPRVRVAGPAVPADAPSLPGGPSVAPAGVPSPTSPPTPLPPPPSVGRTVIPDTYGEALPKPTLPTPAEITEYETRGYRMLRGPHASDPRVQADAQALIAYGQAQRTKTDARNAEVFKADIGAWEKDELARRGRFADQPKTNLELLKGEQDLSEKRRAAELSHRLGGIPETVYVDAIKESHKDAVKIPAAQASISNARRSLVDESMFTGGTANVELSMKKLAAAIGMPLDPRVNATETFKSYMAGVVAQARQALVGGANISNADLAAAERAAAGDITLERGSIKSVLDSLERINVATAVAHQQKLATLAGSDPDRQRGIYGLYGVPSMENIIPQRSVERLLANPTEETARQLDEAYHTPGLARRILMNRRR